MSPRVRQVGKNQEVLEKFLNGLAEWEHPGGSAARNPPVRGGVRRVHADERTGRRVEQDDEAVLEQFLYGVAAWENPVQSAEAK